MKNLAIFISGSGSNMKTILENIKEGRIKGVNPALVLSSTSKARGLEYAEDSGLKTAVFNYKNLSEDEISNGLISLLEESEIDFIILAGFIKILPPALVKKYKNRILNIHPSLIPKFCGKGFYGLKVHEEVIKAGEKESGATVHYVDEGVDTGDIILQRTCPVYPDDTAEVLQKRVLKIEHEIYSEAIQMVISGEN